MGGRRKALTPDAGSAARGAGDAGNATNPVYGEPWIWVGGAGMAAIVLGTVTGVVASNRTDDVKAECDSAAGLCTPKGIEARDGANTLSWVSNLSLGVGLAGVVVAGVLYLKWGPRRRERLSGPRQVAAWRRLERGRRRRDVVRRLVNVPLGLPSA